MVGLRFNFSASWTAVKYKVYTCLVNVTCQKDSVCDSKCHLNQNKTVFSKCSQVGGHGVEAAWAGVSEMARKSWIDSAHMLQIFCHQEDYSI